MRDPATRAHRALGTPSRMSIFEALQEAPEGLDAHEIAQRVGLHHNTVRAHLDLLIDAGLVTRRAEERSRPGRPRLVFQVAAEGHPGEPSGYRLLAEILASYLAGSTEDPSAAAEELGRAWGGHLTERPAPFERLSRPEAVQRLHGLFVDLGFQPELVHDGPNEQMLLRRCPFRDLAKARGEVVCSVHLGLMRGALAEMRAPVTAAELLPFVEPSLCVARLESDAGDGGRAPDGFSRAEPRHPDGASGGLGREALGRGDQRVLRG
jgi:predicted ArsR family transcriptional regulator